MRSVVGIPMLFVLSSVVSACAFTQDGIFFGRWASSTPEDTRAAIDQLRANALADSCENRDPNGAFAPTVIAIGETGVLRDLRGSSSLHKFYKLYAESVEVLHPGDAPFVTFEEFRLTFSGWTTLTTEMNLLIRRTLLTEVLVPSAMNEEITYGTTLRGDTGDLVAAKTTAEGMLVVDRILCHRGSAYQDCDSQFRRGIFDGTTGRQLTVGMKAKEGGVRIDPSSYLPIDASTGCPSPKPLLED